jgi:2',3'-cyclic-nucleotide 2'-phosphodiesterase (5'-nucleotidase family)
MDAQVGTEAYFDSIISPYRDSLTLTMETVVVRNAVPLTRGIPECTLGNLVADLLLERALIEVNDPEKVDLCLINVGGLRVDLPEGDITIGKVFELMPFENEIDVVKLSPKQMQQMLAYLKEKGGQPIAGMRIAFKDNEMKCTVDGEPLDTSRWYYVATSDYLADGGDKMDFFQGSEERIRTGVKIRDAIIDHFRIVGLSGSELKMELDDRLTIK